MQAPMTIDRVASITLDLGAPSAELGQKIRGHLLRNMHSIKASTYPNPSPGSNGNATYVVFKIDVVPCAGFGMCHEIRTLVSFRGSYRHDVPTILTRGPYAVYEVIHEYLRGQGIAARATIRHVSDSAALTAAMDRQQKHVEMLRVKSIITQEDLEALDRHNQDLAQEYEEEEEFTKSLEAAEDAAFHARVLALDAASGFVTE